MELPTRTRAKVELGVHDRFASTLPLEGSEARLWGRGEMAPW